MAVDRSEPAVSIQSMGKIYSPAPRWQRLLIKSALTTPVFALNSVDLEVGPGEVCALVGPNGAGKTTLFSILVGLTTPTTGSARVLGHDVVTESLAIRKSVGWMPSSEQTLFRRHTCADNLRFHGRLFGFSGSRLESAVDEMLELVDLRHVARNSVTSLSSGMKARLQLARALLHRPRILILDEPTAAIDPVAAYSFINLISAIVKDRHISALVSSHRLDEIEALHSHVVLLNEGSVLFDGDLDVLPGRNSGTRFEVEFSSVEDASRAFTILQRASHIERVTTDNRTVAISMEGGVSVGEAFRHLNAMLSQIVGIREVQLPLREVLAQVYGVGDLSEDDAP